MRKTVFLFTLFCIVSYAQDVKVSSGKVERLTKFKSQFVDARNVDVWLPNGYSNTKKYAVLYMHDGQMLYDAETTWNKQAWEIDSIAGKLIVEHKIQKCIIVGIWNNNLKRHPEYFPQKVYQTFTAEQKKFISDKLLERKKIDSEFHPISDNYLQFIVEELKPYIDNTYATYPDRKHTFIAGSSMGGLISLYAICEYPKVFGGAACLSTHWTGIYQNNDNPIPDAIISYLKVHLPNPKNHQIYFDYGDQTLDNLYRPSQEKVDVVMQSKGFTSKNWSTQFFAGKDHSEPSWRERFYIPLEFLLER
jgi:enterochelin esterase-like enzyme